MEISNIIPHIEALIFASDRPLTSLDITELVNNAFGFMEDKITLDQVEAAIEGIVEKYRTEFYPFEMRESGGGWQFLTKKDYHKTVAQLNGEKFLKRLSSAALETLAIIAYKQPITKADIESIRGVSCDYTVQKLLEKELILITGRNEDLPGKPLVYATSKNFMDYFGLNSAADLPKLKEIFDEAMVSPTMMQGELNETNLDDSDDANDEGNGSLLIVSEAGELIEDMVNEEASDVSGNINNETEDIHETAATGEEQEEELIDESVSAEDADSTDEAISEAALRKEDNRDEIEETDQDLEAGSDLENNDDTDLDEEDSDLDKNSPA